METRIHEYLDGELPADALSAAEREQAAALEALLGDASARLRRMPVPDLTARVMAALPVEAAAATAAVPATAEAEGWLARAVGWLWSPHPIRIAFRPAYALVALAALLVVPWALRTGGTDLAPSAPVDGAPVSSSPVAGAPVDMPRVYVQFRLEAPEASEVRLAGSFTDWEPRYPLFQTAPGVWSAVVPLQPGVHDYTFVVDGEHWRTDPHAPSVPDNFGGANSRLNLVPPQNGV